MTAKLTTVGRVFELPHRDEDGREITYFVQVGPLNRISCWTETAPAGSLTIPQLYAACHRQQHPRATE